jgi:hypothetical protein
MSVYEGRTPNNKAVYFGHDPEDGWRVVIIKECGEVVVDLSTSKDQLTNTRLINILELNLDDEHKLKYRVHMDLIENGIDPLEYELYS